MFSLHDHSDYSNASRGFADSSMKLEDMVSTAKKIGLKGVCISDHETISGHIKAKELEQKYDFPVLLGNEIYLVSKKQDYLLRNDYKNSEGYYPHFLLISLDEEGHEQLRQLSSLAWEHGYFNNLFRTTTTMEEVESIIGQNKGHIIGSTACLGGFLPKSIIDWKINGKEEKRNHIDYFIKWGKRTFGDGNFVLECQPAYDDNIEQWTVNNTILELSKEYDVPYIITTDAHYLKKEIFPIHKAFLNSTKESGDREPEKFYATTYLMSENEIYDFFSPHWSKEDIKKGLDETDNIGNRAVRFIFKKSPHIPRIKFEDNWRDKLNKDFFPKDREYIQNTLQSNYDDDVYLMYLIQKGIKELIPLNDYKETFDKINLELKEITEVSNIIGDRMQSYFITVAKIIDIMWNEGDSFVGVGRGSVVVSMVAYLLKITQINPLKMPVDLPFYRFMTAERADFLDIDIDSQHDRRIYILEALKDYFQAMGGDVVNCITFSTLTSKSAILTACRGLGIQNDDPKQMSQSVTVERGFPQDIKTTYYGNPDKDISPSNTFVNLVNQYSDLHLLEIIELIEGLIINRGIHAGGVFFLNEPIYKNNALMISPTGVRCSQWDLHDSEKYGLIKYDLLTTKGMSKLRKTIDLLIKDNYIEKKENLRDTYMSVINPMKINYDTPKTWELIQNNEIMDLFQFNTPIAMSILHLIQPTNLIQLFQTNSLLRLKKQDDAQESPVETYIKYKENIQLAYDEMDLYNVPKKDQEVLKQILDKYYFVADTQEIVMELVKHPELIGMSIADTHALRKGIAKKDKKEQEKQRENIYKKGLERGVSKDTINYIWEVQIKKQLSYSFSIPHVVAYTFIALQEAILCQQYPSIYWDTACLSINAGAEDDDDFRKDSQNVDYGKIGVAIAQIKKLNKKVLLPDINRSNIEFEPLSKENAILVGLKTIANVGDKIIQDILENRPFDSLIDFNQKIQPNTKEFIYLVKAGAFDSLYPDKNRESIMKECIRIIAYNKVREKFKESLNMQNFNAICNMDILPSQYKYFERYWKFKKYVLNNRFKDKKVRNKLTYRLDKISTPFFLEHFAIHLDENENYWYNDKEEIIFYKSDFENIYTKSEDTIKKIMNQPEFVKLYNKNLLINEMKSIASSYCQGNTIQWEMDAIGFYDKTHELALVNNSEYNLTNFSDIPEEPVYTIETNKNKEWKRYELYKIAGTIVNVDKTKKTIFLLTKDGEVAVVTFYKDQFNYYDKMIMKNLPNGKSKRIEESWLKRGNKIILTGYRDGQYFKPKNYYDSIYREQIIKINEVLTNGKLILQYERKGVE